MLERGSSSCIVAETGSAVVEAVGDGDMVAVGVMVGKANGRFLRYGLAIGLEGNGRLLICWLQVHRQRILI